ncbi:MAG: hypothetical protein AAF337_06285 [Pseudomonadota bacterium]
MKPGSTLAALVGSFELAQFDADALKRYDLSASGFWQSFTAVLFLVPLFALALYLQNTVTLRANRTPEPYDIALLIALLDWVVFTLLMVPITRILDVRERYFAAMTVYNWCRPLAFAFFIPVFAVAATGMAGGTAQFALFYLSITLRSIFQGYILHLTLKIGFGAIFAIIVIDILLGELIIITLRKTVLG